MKLNVMNSTLLLSALLVAGLAVGCAQSTTGGEATPPAAEQAAPAAEEAKPAEAAPAAPAETTTTTEETKTTETAPAEEAKH